MSIVIVVVVVEKPLFELGNEAPTKDKAHFKPINDLSIVSSV
jgi:hypothetical protein